MVWMPTYHSAPIVTEIFRGMIAEGCFDVSELGLTYYLRTFKNGVSPFIAIPVFPNRAFRHSAIFVNKASGIDKPQDLNGKTIGELALYGHDAGIMPKGMLMDEFGFKPGDLQMGHRRPRLATKAYRFRAPYPSR